PGISGTKEASGDMDQVQRIINGRPKGFSVLSGDDSLTLRMMGMGSEGTISVAANCVPGRFAELIRLCASGKNAEAKKVHEELLPLFNVLFCESNPIPIKYIMAKLGYGSGTLRLPLTELTENNRTAVDNVLRGIGL
ncbi:MAG: dihydrodipicolinate synthase family protein, partial [Methanomassiliicoccaceae archaeon]|nr:dihydrodipicolinate synthase family protein [Methanomassiliicoccaceae archaeon]